MRTHLLFATHSHPRISKHSIKKLISCYIPLLSRALIDKLTGLSVSDTFYQQQKNFSPGAVNSMVPSSTNFDEKNCMVCCQFYCVFFVITRFFFRVQTRRTRSASFKVCFYVKIVPFVES